MVSVSLGYADRVRALVLAVAILYFSPLWGVDPIVEQSKYQFVPIVEKVKAESFGSVQYLEIVGKHEGWMNLAGIPPSDWDSANFIISHESGWNPNAVNASSGACGLVQSLPCSKIGANWNDPVTALKWGHNYVTQRYGSWAGAVSFWQANHWY